MRADYPAQLGDTEAIKVAFPIHPVTGGATVGLPINAPLVRTELFNADGGVQWLSLFQEALVTEAFETVIELESDVVTYQPGRLHRERWNYGVFGPVAGEFTGVFRVGDELVVAPSLYGDGGGHLGFAPSTGSIRLFRDGELIAEEPLLGRASVQVPPEPADYRVGSPPSGLGSLPLFPASRRGLGVPVRPHGRRDPGSVAAIYGAVQPRPRTGQHLSGGAAAVGAGQRRPGAHFGAPASWIACRWRCRSTTVPPGRRRSCWLTGSCWCSTRAAPGSCRRAQRPPTPRATGSSRP